MKPDIARDLGEFRQPQRLKRLESVLRQRTKSLTVVLDRVHGSHNISAAIRSADAFGIQEMHVVASTLESSEPLFEENQGISLGAHRWVDVHRHASVVEGIRELQKKQFVIVVIEPESSKEVSVRSQTKVSLPSMCVSELPFNKRLALIFGNERDGVSSEFRSAASLCAHIPMFGFVESLNVSVAVAICLFCSTIAPTPAARQVPVISDEDFQEIRKLWLQEDLLRGKSSLNQYRA